MPLGPLELRWRLVRVLRWGFADLSALLIVAASRVRLLRCLPRCLIVPAERTLIAFRGEDLFDREHYLGCNPDVRLAGVDPLDHYLRHGWREARPPNAKFDDAHYRAQSGLSRSAPVSALAHYLVVGRRRGLSPVPDVDISLLRRTMPGLGIARIDPYRHLLTTKTGPGREQRPDVDATLLKLDALSPQCMEAKIDVIVPVYAGRAETLNTLLHVLQSRCRIGYSVIVVNDDSPDGDLCSDLRHLKNRGLIELKENESNQGFVASVNTGCTVHPARDVVWLNADTEVYDGWIDRLHAAAYRAPGIASVTPLTNNGTIASYPRFNADTPGPLEMEWAEIDRLAARFNTAKCVQAPTGVGFCMYVRRAALRDVGPLDQAAFGRGYGEENDFCQRAVAKGWKNVIAADVFVRHFGATSFRDSRADRVEAAMRVLDRRHPDYRAKVRSFIDNDPLEGARRTLDLARLGALSRRRNMLIVSHSRGGGTEQHIQQETARLEAQGWSVYTLNTGTGGPGSACLSHAGAAITPQLSALRLEDGWIWKALSLLRIERVQIHHLIDFPREAPLMFARRLRQLGVPYSVTVHDYFAVCPRVNLVDLSGRYCGEPDAAGCRSCLLSRGSSTSEFNITKWRGRYGVLLSGAQSVRVPDRDVSERLQRYFPKIRNIEVVPHEPSLQIADTPRGPRRRGPLRLAVIGAIGPIKGYDALLGFARYAASARLELEITLIGYSRDDDTLREHGVCVSGPYLNDDIQNHISDLDPDLIWIPSIWPETYCYTLSIALASGRPIAAFDIGAIATRLRAAGRGCLMPLEISVDPKALWNRFQAEARKRFDTREHLVS